MHACGHTIVWMHAYTAVLCQTVFKIRKGRGFGVRTCVSACSRTNQDLFITFVVFRSSGFGWSVFTFRWSGYEILHSRWVDIAVFPESWFEGDNQWSAFFEYISLYIIWRFETSFYLTWSCELSLYITWHFERNRTFFQETEEFLLETLCTYTRVLLFWKSAHILTIHLPI